MSFIAELRQRKLVQWALAYAAGAFALVQGLDLVVQRFGMPELVVRLALVVVAIGFVVVLVLAWYHGERGAQRVSGTELAILALLLALGGGALWRVARAPAGGDTAAAPAADDKSIAVLPLANTSGDPDNEYFSDGLSEELISVLGKVPDLKIIGRNSSFHFKGSTEKSAAIGAQLGVAHLLEGSVRKQGDRVRIAVGLIKAADGREVWSETYDRKLEDIFAVQSEIASAVVAGLKVKLLGGGITVTADRGTANLAAYNSVLQGQYHVRRFNEADQRAAVALFEEAVRTDPGYARARAELGLALQGLAGRYLSDEKEIVQALARARTEAETALRLDPNLAIAHSAKASTLFTEFAFAGALRENARALELEPSNPNAIQARSFQLVAAGRIDEGDEYSRRAIAADPFLVPAYMVHGRNLQARGELDAAEANWRKVLELQRDASHVHAYLTLIALKRGDAAAAAREAALEKDAFWHDYANVLALQAQADRAAADQALARLSAEYEFSGAFQVAVVHAVRNEPDRMFEWLDRAYDVRDQGLTQLMVTPFVIDHRADPRFAALMKKLGIVEAARAP